MSLLYLVQNFTDRWKRLLFAAVLSCPWYVSTQSDCCQQARHNQFLAIYVAKDDQFYAPVNFRGKKDNDVFELEVWRQRSLM
jgi:hypothetical protein